MKSWHAILAILILWAGLYLPGIGSGELGDDEARQVLPGIEMLRTADWLNLRLAGETYERQPPLGHWLTAYAVQANDGAMEEWLVRLPSAIAILLLVGGTFLLVRIIGGVETALFVSLMVLSAVGVMHKGRLAEADALHFALFGSAWLWWLTFILTDKRPWRAWIGAGALLGLGTLAAGPWALILFYLLVTTHALAHRDWKCVLHPAHAVGILSALASLVPWAVLSHNASGGAGAWWSQISALGMADGTDWADRGWLGFHAIGNFMPWAVLLLPLFFKRFRSWLGLASDDSIDRSLRWGLLASFSALLLIPPSGPQAPMLLILPAAVLVARSYLLARPIPSRVVEHSWGIVLRVFIVLLGIAAVAGPFFVPTGDTTMAVTASILVVLAGYLLWQILPLAGSNVIGLLLVSAALMTLTTTVYAVHIQPHLVEREKSRPLAEQIQWATREIGQTIIAYKLGYQPWTVYTWPQTIEINSWDRLPESGGFLLLLTDQEWNQSAQRIKERYPHTEEAQTFANTWDDSTLRLLHIRAAE